MPDKTVIGVTGGIGSGKSRVCAYLAERCRLPLIDLDAVCRQLLLPQAPGWLALKQLLPDAFFTGTDELDRQALREAIFADAALRHEIDAALHPLARREMNGQIAQLNAPAVLADIPLLFEAEWQDSVQLIVVVYAELPVRLRRIAERDGVTQHQACAAAAAQSCLLKKAALADKVIDNSGDWRHTCLQLDRLAERLRFFLKNP